MVGRLVVIPGFLFLACGYLVQYWSKAHRPRPYRRGRTWLTYYAPGAATLMTGAFVVFAAVAYAELLPWPAAVPPNEPEYFAVQTITTVGYGSALTPVSPTAPATLVSSFQLLSTCLMLPLVAGWVFTIASVAHFLLPRRR